MEADAIGAVVIVDNGRVRALVTERDPDSALARISNAPPTVAWQFVERKELEMPVIRRLGRELLAPMFVTGGLDAVRHPETKIAKAETVTGPFAESLGLPDDPLLYVQLNGAVQVVAGTMLALGRWPRIAALALAGSLIPTTLAGHRFWRESDPGDRAAQRIQFLKNAAMLGGLLVVASERSN